MLSALVSEETISEAAALSTCNRTELYLVATDSVEAETAGLGVLAREAGIPPTELLGPLYSLRAADAARHLYRVTAPTSWRSSRARPARSSTGCSAALWPRASGPARRRRSARRASRSRRLRSSWRSGTSAISLRAGCS